MPKKIARFDVFSWSEVAVAVVLDITSKPLVVIEVLASVPEEMKYWQRRSIRSNEVFAATWKKFLQKVLGVFKCKNQKALCR